MPATTVGNDPCMPFRDNEKAFYTALRAEGHGAYSCLYLRLHNQFVPMACQRGCHYDEAVDVLNDCLAIFLVKVREGSYVFQENAKITTYLYRVCYNQLLNYIDKRQARQEVSFDALRSPTRPNDDGDPPPGERFDLADEPDIAPEQAEWVARLNKALAMLGDDCQRLLQWFYVDSLSLSLIAERLGITVESATVKRHRCAKYLRDRYANL
jgi:RNA polymerase sigma factor (sigma-70 family)